MNRAKAKLVARAAVTERAKSLFGVAAMEFIQSQEISRQSQAVPIIGIGNQAIDTAMMLRDQAIKLNPHVPSDMINIAIMDGFQAVVDAIRAAAEAAATSPDYMVNRELSIAGSDIEHDDLVRIIGECNQAFHP